MSFRAEDRDSLLRNGSSQDALYDEGDFDDEE